MNEGWGRYARACHAMQSAVAYEIETAPEQSGTSPKHLRVGINAAMSEHAGLIKLLMAKGIITPEEHDKALADAMEEEVARYQRRYPNVKFV